MCECVYTCLCVWVCDCACICVCECESVCVCLGVWFCLLCVCAPAFHSWGRAQEKIHGTCSQETSRVIREKYQTRRHSGKAWPLQVKSCGSAGTAPTWTGQAVGLSGGIAFRWGHSQQPEPQRPVSAVGRAAPGRPAGGSVGGRPGALLGKGGGCALAPLGKPPGTGGAAGPWESSESRTCP